MESVLLAYDLALISLIGGLLSLDRRAVGQLMLAQPVVAIGLIGLVLGDLSTGIALGALVQLLFMASTQFGANVPPNELVAALSIGGGALMFERQGGGSSDAVMFTVAILAGTPMATLGRSLEVSLERANLSIAHRADRAASAGQPQRLMVLTALGLSRTFGANALAVAVGAAWVFAVLWGTRAMIDGVIAWSITAVATYIIPALGLAVALSLIRRRRALALAGLTFTMITIALGRLV